MTADAEALVAEIKRRRLDYAAHEIAEDRRKLIEEWRAAHPECVEEAPNRRHHMLDCIDPGRPDNRKDHPEIWANDVYQVTVRRWLDDPVFGTRGGMIQIGINSHDGTARHDWRDFQGIKNQFAGPECEAFELYPAESRLMDPSNYYSLWCFPGLKRIKVGTNEARRVFDANEALAPQRAFEKG